MGPWFVRPVILAAAVARPHFLRRRCGSGRCGARCRVLTAIRIADDWPLADNHIYLLGYWLLAVSLALRSRDAAATLADGEPRR